MEMICPNCKTDNGSYGVKCYKCGADLQPAASVSFPATNEGVFALDKYFVNQKMLALKEKYHVLDETGNKLFYVEREFFKLAASIHFFTDDTKSKPVMSLIKKGGLAGLADFGAQFTLTLPDGQPIAVFKRQGIMSTFIRRSWNILDPGGHEIGTAREDSIFMSLIRRYAPFGELFRTNFVITHHDREIGKFIRKLAIRDKYALDLTADPQRSFDRRMAVALAVLLDTAERR